MNGTEILREIVVKISSDRKAIKGTGFFVSNNEVATCYHVLAEEKSPLLERYYIKNDAWPDWKEVKPSIDRCVSSKDVAILQCPEPLELRHNEIRIAPWNSKPTEFLSRGYDFKAADIEGAWTIDEKDCRIVEIGYLGPEKRLQLRSIKNTLLPGRSGSPVWSVNQKAIVGMIDYQGGEENIQTDRSMAIPIEMLGIDIPLPKGEPINVPNLPVDFLPRPDDLKSLRELVLSPEGRKSAITGKILNTGGCCASSIGLQGMGGIGKSVLAAALARDEKVQEVFSDGVIWISLGQQPNLPNRQLQLLQFLDKDHRPVKDTQDGLGCLRFLLLEKSCLIILDDVWAMDVARAFNALGPNCQMLITTRNLEIVRGLKAREFCLDVLGLEQSMQLLSLSSGMKIEDLDPQAKEVAEECDRLPLALAMVGSMVHAALDKGRPDPWKHVLKRLQSADLDKIKAEFPDYPYPNLLRAIEVSVENLEPEEKKRYLEMAVFPEDAQIPEAALQILWNLDENDARDLADLFVDRSLAMLNNGRLSLHDLQHDFATKRTGDLVALHDKLVDSYEKKCPSGWHTGPNDGYFLQHLAYHLLNSGKKEELKKLDLDYRWLEARLEKTDITSLISDFDFLPEDEELSLCQDCLRLSSHVLFENPFHLADQIMGRMQHISSSGIRGLIKQARTDKGRPWLRPLTTSLTPPGGPLIRTLSGHTFGTRAVAMTPDGRRAVSASGDKTLKVWDLKSGQEIRTLSGHASEVKAVAVTPDGRHAVSASGDKTLKVWDLKSGQEIQTLSGHSMRVNAAIMTPDGRRAVSASDDCTLKVWDLKSGQEIQTLSGHTLTVKAVALTPDGLHVISGSWDNTIRIWDLKRGRETQTLSHAGWVEAVAVTLDGQHVISGSVNDSTIKIWDLESDLQMRTLSGHTDWITSVALTPDGLRAVSGSWDQTLKVWDLENGREIRTLSGHSGGINAVAMTPDGQRAVSASGNSLKVWDLKSGREIRTLSGHDNGVIFHVALTPSGLRAVSVSYDNILKLWDLDRGSLIASFTGDSFMESCSIASDGKTIVAGEVSGIIHFLRLEGIAPSL